MGNALALGLLMVLGTPVLVALACIWNGYALSIIWGWFVVPYFNLPPLSIPLAIGVTLVVSVLSNHRTGIEAEKEMEPGKKISILLGRIILRPALVLLFGWIVTKFL
jgi:hypothetical protein